MTQDPPRATWSAALAKLGDDDSEELLAQEALAGWLADNGCDAGAVYLEAEPGQLVLEVEAGEVGLPDKLEGEVPSTFNYRPLPGGVLLFRGAPPDHLTEIGEAGFVIAFSARLASLKREIKRAQFEAGRRDVAQEALYDVGLAIASTLDVEQLTEAILTWALSLLDARRAALYLGDSGGFRLARSLGGDARATVVPYDASSPPADVLPGASFLLAAPIEVEGRAMGLLVVGDKESRSGVGPFTAADERTLSLFANQAAIALENARLHREALEKERLEREMELAAEIQRQILPKVIPSLPGYELAGWNRPARQVGGDYYDLLPRGEGRLLVTVGDVSGKGVPASLLVSTLHSASRLLLDRQDLGPELAEKLNRHVCESSLPSKFITLVVGEIDTARHRFVFVNAGHNPGVVVGADGGVRCLAATGVPLGLIPLARYQMGEADFAPGDLLCLYSDGITEQADGSSEEFGLERLIQTLESHRTEPLPQVIAAVEAAVGAFAAGAPQGDDQTVVLVRRMG
ncbi:MAG TPA: SpoIIE family protein phosphatase [Thermoanaerobaculia bacterium]|nr:SpoIIE family protein phosphatase [Thermoanaerobaculia bacterium]